MDASWHHWGRHDLHLLLVTRSLGLITQGVWRPVRWKTNMRVLDAADLDESPESANVRARCKACVFGNGREDGLQNEG